MSAAARLTNIKIQIENHDSNAWAKAKGWGPIYTAHPDAKILIIGQAPGRLAQESGVPWDDPSGRNLRRWMGIGDEIFYDPAKTALIPMDFYFPGSAARGDIPPRKDFADLWHKQILAEIQDVRLILLIGQYAQGYYLGKAKKRTLTETVKAYAEYMPAYFPLVHPSPRNAIWQKKNPWFVDEVLPKLQRRVQAALK